MAMLADRAINITATTAAEEEAYSSELGPGTRVETISPSPCGPLTTRTPTPATPSTPLIINAAVTFVETGVGEEVGGAFSFDTNSR